MGYYEDKRKELFELLDLVRRERATFQELAKREQERLDKQIELLNYFGIYGEQDSDLGKILKAKEKLNRELLEFEQHKQLTNRETEKTIAEGRARLEASRRESDKQLEDKRQGLMKLARDLAAGGSREAITQLAGEKSQGFPWLAKAYEDYFLLQDLQLRNYLETKVHPVQRDSAASTVRRQLAKERREAEKAARIASYLLEYCRYLAPWLDEYICLEVKELDEIIKDIHSSWEKKEKVFDEEVKRHFGPKYYEGLTPTERLQKKLDWYWDRPDKYNWQIGRDYERYVGYLYETNGWNVYYHGKKAFEDLGRDLVCKKDEAIEIVQCKYWAREKTIHEKHIYYLFGTTVEYYLENIEGERDLQLGLFPSLIQKRNVTPKLIATIDISPKAEQVANLLGVKIERIPFQRYPSVKCNVSRRTGEKIFHLPFDQQYDTALIEEERNECYVSTVKEAEDLGFRRAFRWHGSTDSIALV